MAAVDYFLKINGIPGESTDAKHKNEIDVLSWSWGASNGASFASGSGGGAGKVQMQDFSFSMKIDKAFSKLMLHNANGKHIPDAELTCRKAGEKQQEFLKIKFSELLVSSVNIGGQGGNDVIPMCTVSIAYSKIEFAYCPQKQDGTLDAADKTGWSVKTNEKV